jgi:hypothetical protein
MAESDNILTNLQDLLVYLLQSGDLPDAHPLVRQVREGDPVGDEVEKFWWRD